MSDGKVVNPVGRRRSVPPTVIESRRDSVFEMDIGVDASSPTDGRLIYAVGDIHGRFDSLSALILGIRSDAGARAAPALPIVVFLGDYVDRGPESDRVLEAIIELGDATEFEVVALKGNHEDALLQFLDDADTGPDWMSYGAGATLAAYGVRPPRMRTDREGWRQARDAFAQRLPQTHLDFLQGLKLRHVIGDFAFVHAGVRPGVPLAEQSEHDLIWIREPFLGSRTRHEKVVVHGHTPVEEPFDGSNRIGVDTGAYATGVLTAVRLEGTSRAFLQSAPDGQGAARVRTARNLIGVENDGV